MPVGRALESRPRGAGAGVREAAARALRRGRLRQERDGRPQAIRDYLAKAKYTFTVYLDRGNVLADALGATTTPHCFVFRERKLVYTGRINDRRPPDAIVSSKSASPPPPPPPLDPLLKKAILAALEGKAPDVPVDAPTGCRIKRQ